MLSSEIPPKKACILPTQLLPMGKGGFIHCEVMAVTGEICRIGNVPLSSKYSSPYAYLQKSGPRRS